MDIEQITRMVVDAVKRQAGNFEASPKQMQLYVPVGVSGRHIHLSAAHLDLLFGPAYRLTVKKELMGGQYAAEECVTIIGDKLCAIENVRVLGPVRGQTQAEISYSDAVKLGVSAPLRESGNLSGSAPITVVGPKGAVYLNEGCIVAARHIHMPTGMGFQDGQIVSVEAKGERGLRFNNVKIRTDASFRLEMHIDTDEANACGLKTGDTVKLIQ